MPLTPFRLRILVACLLAVSFLGALDHTVVSTSLATIAGELGSLEHMSWIVVGYTLASTVLIPVIGRLGDRIGPRTLFLIAVAGFVLASLACGFSTRIEFLVLARVVQGFCSAGLQLMSITVLAHVTTPRQRPRYLAVVGAAFPIAILVGPLIGGVITDYWGWPWVFWINVPVGAIAFVFAIVALPRVDALERRPLDLGGAVTFAVALIALVLGVSWLPDAVMRSAALVAFAIAAAGFVVFFVVELGQKQPIVPLRLFGGRTVGAGLALTAVIGVGLFSVTAYLPTYFQMAYRTSATVSGIVPIACVFGMLVSNLITGHLASRSGRYRPFPIVGTVLAAGGLLVMSVLPVGVPLWVPALVMAVVGIGTGAFMNLIIAVVQSAAPARETGSITASINLVRQVGATTATAIIGGVIGVAVAGGLPVGWEASTITPALVRAAPEGVQQQIAALYGHVFAPIFAVLAGVYALGVVAALLLPAGRLADTSSVPVVEPVAQEAP